MKVNETITAMLKSWPSLYSSRSDALRNLFSSSNYEWKDGELVPTSEGTLYVDRPLADVLEDETKLEEELATAYEKNSELSISLAIDDLLHIRKENNEIRFVWENAELLARTPGQFRANPLLMFTENFKLPVDVKDDWREAAKELAVSVLSHRFITHPQYIPSYDEREMIEFERAKKFAQEFLDNFDPEKVAAAHIARIEKFRLEAEALGFAVAKK